MNIVFLGSGPFAVPSLEVLWRHATRHPLRAVVSRPDRRARRGRRLLQTPVKLRATELGVECRSPESVGEAESLAWLRSLDIDLCIVAAYGEILRRDFLDVPSLGTFNLHASLLPKYRGAAPVAHAILAGEKTTGVTLFRIEEGLDSGPVVARRETVIEALETAGELEERLSRLGAELLEEELEAFAGGTHTETPQDHGLATRAPKLGKEMGLLDWDVEAVTIRDRVRALNPWPTAYAFLERQGREPERMALLAVDVGDLESAALPGTVVEVSGTGFQVACRDGSVRVLELQRQGKKALSSAAFLNGYPLRLSDRFLGETPPGG
ncbi:MAG: methionyl-tRNA formyltransferase [Planctomycetota bacterium]|nr:methionyl-tRNA formyltransferase [Planctomycetota bacterium]